MKKRLNKCFKDLQNNNNNNLLWTTEVTLYLSKSLKMSKLNTELVRASDKSSSFHLLPTFQKSICHSPLTNCRTKVLIVTYLVYLWPTIMIIPSATVSNSFSFDFYHLGWTNSRRNGESKYSQCRRLVMLHIHYKRTPLNPHWCP